MLNLFRSVVFILFLNWLPLTQATTNCAEVTQIPVVECEALLDLYNNTGGPHWKNHTGWNETNTPCDWGGVTCSNSLENLKYLSNLDLFNNHLNGSIPDSLGNLSSLWGLDLSSNQLDDLIPGSLGKLNNLHVLYLFNNQLIGSIPESLGNLNNLQTLNLSGNQLSGPIPEFLGKSKLKNLQELSLERNQFSGYIPESLGNLDKLKYLYLFDNKLSGTIPNSLEKLGGLQGLQLDYNQLNGTIPEFLGNLNNLQFLGLANNKFIGSIPESLGNLSKLVALALENNRLSGSIPESLGNINSLEFLSLSNNKFRGLIPESLGSLNNLVWLAMSNNELCGDIPSSLINLKLKVLTLDNNHLTTSDPMLIKFLNRLDPSWEISQTPPYDCSSLSVKLIYFSATTTLDGTYFEWETGTENDSVGFHLWQAKPLEGNCEQFTNETQLTGKMIPSQGDENGGAYYEYRYEGSVNIPNSCYGLEERETSGKRNFYLIGPGIEKWKTFSIE